MLAICLVSATVAAPVPPAYAQNGGGLYEPFAEPASAGQARNFIRGLNGGRELEPLLSDRLLERGTSVRRGGLSHPRSQPASARAGIGLDAGFLDGWLVVLAALTLGGAAAGLARRLQR
jgi:hypothetical protein